MVITRCRRNDETELNSAILIAWPKLLEVIGEEKTATLICPYVGVWMACLMVPDWNPNLDSFVSLEVTANDDSTTEDNTEKNPNFIGGVEVMAMDEKDKLEVVTSRYLPPHVFYEYIDFLLGAVVVGLFNNCAIILQGH